MKTTIMKDAEVVRDWYVVDAAKKPAGRLAVAVANLLRGRGKTTYTPHVDMGDFVVVLNAAEVKLTGSKEEKKIYDKYTGFTGGLKQVTAKAVRARTPERIVRDAVKGMLPKNRLANQQIRRLKVYAGTAHPHEAQQPKVLEPII